METRIPLLAIENLSVEFRTRAGIVQVLDHIDLHIMRGETVGIVGESGSGKSVLAYTIMGILDPAGRLTQGHITFGGLDLVSADEESLAAQRGREFAMIFQHPRTALNPIRPVGKQIADVLYRHANLLRRDIKGRAMELLTRVKIADPQRCYRAYPFELSGGMCQRVLIAMALACAPALLIADEPTTGLDVVTQATIMELLSELGVQNRMATLFITHDLGLAATYCERIVVMHAGHVVETAPTKALFGAPRHPYTAKLIAATPHATMHLHDLAAIPGTLPDLRSMLPPCRYSSRCERYTAVCDSTPLTTARPGSRSPGSVLEAIMSVLLEIAELHKHFPVTTARTWQRFLPGRGAPSGAPEPQVMRAVDGVSLTVETGECVGLVGESGSGKSTLVRVITRLLEPTAGSIRFQGRDIGSIPVRRFAHAPERALVQLVFQDPTDSLNPRFTALATIAEPLRLLGHLTERARLRARVEELADLVGLSGELLSRFPHQLSGGQKARVGIARAIALHPALLVLDEPTSALDVSVQAVILRLLADLQQRLGMSYLFISHDLNVVRLLCARVLVMYRGKIVEAGSRDDIFSRPEHAYTRALIAALPTLTY